MNKNHIAPCGLNCELCLGFQRAKNKCVGCIPEGNKPAHCAVCSIKSCPEKKGNIRMLCGDCPKYPCRRLKALDKRYRTQYGESLTENFAAIKAVGMEAFLEAEENKWACKSCGKPLCVHRDKCLQCGAENPFFPKG